MPIKLTTAQFISKAIELHGEKYDYSKVIYKNSSSKIIIICKIHGEYSIVARSHLSSKKCGCRKCGFNREENFEEFLKKSSKIHNGKYDYNKSKYINSKTDICIICPEHGEFWQRPASHLKGSGCLRCGNSKAGEKRTKDISYFIEKSNKIHDFKYEYSISKYISSNDDLKIICPKHGEFTQKASAHMRGKGCLKCTYKVSKPEVEIYEFLRDLNYEIWVNKRNIIKPYELDIYIPELRKAIEFNGLYWHYSPKYFKPGKHAQKSNLCREKGIKLLHIREDLWIKDKEKMKKVIQKFLQNLKN